MVNEEIGIAHCEVRFFLFNKVLNELVILVGNMLDLDKSVKVVAAHL